MDREINTNSEQRGMKRQDNFVLLESSLYSPHHEIINTFLCNTENRVSNVAMRSFNTVSHHVAIRLYNVVLTTPQ